MKTITINVPDDCEIKIVKKEEKKESKYKCEFKKGDVITSSTGACIAIFEYAGKRFGSDSILAFYSTLYAVNSKKLKINKIDYGIGKVEECRFATKEEINTLIEVLKQEAAQSEDARKVLKEAFNIDYKPIIRTYQDLIDNHKIINGYYIDMCAHITETCNTEAKKECKDVATSEKIAKSMLAMAMISQLMPYYGGVINDEAWIDIRIPKYTIERINNTIVPTDYNIYRYSFLAFHTENQRDEFLKFNEQLVKDYLMID